MFARTSAAARLLRCGGARARAAGRSRSLSGAAEVAALGIPAQVVVAAQAATGAPWWLAIGGTTVALRVGMLPLLWYQLAETRRFGTLRPQLAAIRDECRAIEPPSARAAQTLLRGWRCCRAASVQPLAIVAVPLVQIPLLIWSLVGIRRMVDAGSPLTEQMRAGGPGTRPQKLKTASRIPTTAREDTYSAAFDRIRLHSTVFGRIRPYSAVFGRIHCIRGPSYSRAAPNVPSRHRVPPRCLSCAQAGRGTSPRPMRPASCPWCRWR